MMLPSLSARSRPLLALALIPLAALLWAYGSTLAETQQVWATKPQYSHGYLIPVFAALLLWLRRDRLRLDEIGPSWWGVPLVLAALALRLVGTWFGWAWFDGVSLIPCLAGLCLAAGGRGTLRWAWPAVLFLLFMVPLPYRVDTALSGPLQNLATICSTYLLQTLGLPALAEGNIIRINDAQIGVVEACSGLRMLVVFFALSTGMALLLKAPLGDRLFLVATSVPIALVVNVIRITVTGALHETVSSETANVFFHDVAGWLMPPLALGLLWLEWKILGNLLIPNPKAARPPARSKPRSAPAVPGRQPRITRSATATGAGGRRPAPPTEPKAQTPDPTPRPEPVPAHRGSA
jgi:exosortase